MLTRQLIKAIDRSDASHLIRSAVTGWATGVRELWPSLAGEREQSNQVEQSGGSAEVLGEMDQSILALDGWASSWTLVIEEN